MEAVLAKESRGSEDGGMKDIVDVIVVGAGPAGCACGIFLARAGLRVRILEGGKHPRHHIGESLLPGSMRVLRELGITEGEMISRFQRKAGARFYDSEMDRMAEFGFAASDGGTVPAFQVLREAFDAMLCAKARDAGCEVLEEMKVVGVEEESARVGLSDGREMEGRFLVDATGRGAMVARKRGTLKIVKEYGRVAIYNYFAGLAEHDARDGEFITMYVFDGGWVWLIPLADGRTSVGIVWSKKPGAGSQESEVKKEERVFWETAGTMLRLEKRLRAARATEEFRAIGDYSYSVSEKFGAKFVLVGDAAGFLDPIFSSGVHLALCSAERASAGIVEKLRTGSDVGLRAYEEFMEQGFRVFGAFVERFYNRGLVKNVFFMENKPAAMHAGVTAILAGEVWDRGNPAMKLLGV
jgi:flavin-dependent dehydrogenase